jgi:signal transduction histidine kinase/CheY-like chemotaxis protein
MIPAIVWEVCPDDPSGNRYNKRWLEYTGVQIGQWAEAIHPDDLSGVIDAWAEAQKQCSVWEAEYRLRDRSGNFRWFLARSVPICDDNSKVQRWFGTAIDISEVRQARDEANLLAEAGLVLSSDLDYQKTFENLAGLVVPRLADWFAIDVADEETGLLRRIAVMNQDPRQVELGQELEQKYPVDPNAPRGRYEVWRSGKTDYAFVITEEMLLPIVQDERHLEILRELNLHSYICVALTARGQSLGTLTLCYSHSGRTYTPRDVRLAEDLGRRAGVAIDNARLHAAVSELAAAERAARAEAERAGRLKDEFLATLSHELRTPLNSVLGWSYLLKTQAEPGSELAEGLAIIERNARSQAELVQELLDMSRIVSGKLHLEPSPMDLAETVRCVVHESMPQALEKGTRLTASLPASIPFWGDSARLQQVVRNLLSNALKFAPGGEVDVELCEDGQECLLIVRDTGQGIAPEFLPRVWERFCQQDGSVVRKFGGLGIGLSIVRQLVMAHGGAVTAHSEGPQRGATFTVRLPQFGGSDCNGQPASIRAHNLEGARVLLVDDDEDSRELMRRILAEARGHVRVAESAEAALSRLEEEQPDVLISDIGMPGRDGYSLIAAVRERYAKLPALALTAYARPVDKTKALEAGFDLHLSKPVLPLALLEAVQSLLGRDKA